jgi:hypothetical protein
MTDEVFEGARNDTLMPNWVESSKKALTFTKELCCTAMARKTNIKGWGIRKICIGSNNLVQAAKICNREAAFEIFAQW